LAQGRKKDGLAQSGVDTQYPARDAYRDPDVVSNYERSRFSGFLGRYRYRREQKGVSANIKLLPKGLVVLDCPCGTGRWWPLLERKADTIHGIDISPTMLKAAQFRKRQLNIKGSFELGDAENLPLEDGSFDLVFSHALTKHLPTEIQRRVLQEFARVSREWVLCSFSIATFPSRALQKVGSIRYGSLVTVDDLNEWSAAAGLVIVNQHRCTTPLGTEFSVMFKKK